MEVRLLVPRATITGAENVGDIVMVSDAEAKRMIEAGQAAPVARAAEPERAVKRGRPVKGEK